MELALYNIIQPLVHSSHVAFFHNHFYPLLLDIYLYWKTKNILNLKIKNLKPNQDH